VSLKIKKKIIDEFFLFFNLEKKIGKNIRKKFERNFFFEEKYFQAISLKLSLVP